MDKKTSWLLEKCEDIRNTLKNISSEIDQAICSTVRELLGERQTHTISFREWGYDTNAIDCTYITAYDKDGPAGGGSPISITLTEKEEKQDTYSVEVSCEYYDIDVKDDDIQTLQAAEILRILEQLKEDILSGEWTIDNEGLVVPDDDYNEEDM